MSLCIYLSEWVSVVFMSINILNPLQFFSTPLFITDNWKEGELILNDNAIQCGFKISINIFSLLILRMNDNEIYAYMYWKEEIKPPPPPKSMWK